MGFLHFYSSGVCTFTRCCAVRWLSNSGHTRTNCIQNIDQFCSLYSPVSTVVFASCRTKKNTHTQTHYKLSRSIRGTHSTRLDVAHLSAIRFKTTARDHRQRLLYRLARVKLTVACVRLSVHGCVYVCVWLFASDSVGRAGHAANIVRRLRKRMQCATRLGEDHCAEGLSTESAIVIIKYKMYI